MDFPCLLKGQSGPMWSWYDGTALHLSSYPKLPMIMRMDSLHSLLKRHITERSRLASENNCFSELSLMPLESARLARIKYNELGPQHNSLFSDWWNAIFFSVQKINLWKSQHTLHKINKAEHGGYNLHMFIYRRCLQWEGLRWKIGSEDFILWGFALTLLFR